jgi:hypothetical protein
MEFGALLASNGDEGPELAFSSQFSAATRETGLVIEKFRGKALTGHACATEATNCSLPAVLSGCGIYNSSFKDIWNCFGKSM